MTLFAITNYHWPICWMICFILFVSILALTTGNPVYLISTKGTRRVWPVSRGCLLLHGTWCYYTFAFIGGPCCPTLHFVFAVLDYDCVWHMLTSLFCIYRDGLWIDADLFALKSFLKSDLPMVNIRKIPFSKRLRISEGMYMQGS
jgi:hypothetical protein